MRPAWRWPHRNRKPVAEAFCLRARLRRARCCRVIFSLLESGVSRLRRSQQRPIPAALWLSPLPQPRRSTLPLAARRPTVCLISNFSPSPRSTLLCALHAPRPDAARRQTSRHEITWTQLRAPLQQDIRLACAQTLAALPTSLEEDEEALAEAEAKTTCGGENDMSGDLLLALQYRVSKKRLLASAAASPTDGTEPPDS